MNRRMFIGEANDAMGEIHGALGGVGSSLVAPVADSVRIAPKNPVRTSTLGLDEYTTPLDFQHAAHLLRRTMFGPKYTELNQAVGQQAAAVIDYMLNTINLPSPPVDFYQTDARRQKTGEKKKGSGGI